MFRFLVEKDGVSKLIIITFDWNKKDWLELISTIAVRVLIIMVIIIIMVIFIIMAIKVFGHYIKPTPKKSLLIVWISIQTQVNDPKLSSQQPKQTFGGQWAR
jgi:hypothetical protein